MIKNTFGANYEPEATTGLGLIYRLNDLWRDVDRIVRKGDLKMWNLLLDRIYCNLLYRNPIEEELDDEGNIVDVKLGDKDQQIYDVLNKKINTIRLKLRDAIKKKDKLRYQYYLQKQYEEIMLKDIWLRKFMQQHNKLYMKEYDNSPGNALFGR